MKDLDYTALNALPEADLSCKWVKQMPEEGKLIVRIKNNSATVAVANRLRLVNRTTGERVLPVIMSDNYITLLPGEEQEISVEVAATELLKGDVDILVKQYAHVEKVGLRM